MPRTRGTHPDRHHAPRVERSGPSTPRPAHQGTHQRHGLATLQLKKDGTIEEIYNGPGSRIWGKGRETTEERARVSVGNHRYIEGGDILIVIDS